MNDQIKQIAQRIRELREILDVDAADLAKQVNVSVAEYNQYENAESDIPIGVIYAVAAALNVDPTVLLTGDAPRMSDYTIVRQGRGVSVERYKGYKFSSLAFNYIGRQFDPMIVDLDPMESPRACGARRAGVQLRLKRHRTAGHRLPGISSRGRRQRVLQPDDPARTARRGRSGKIPDHHQRMNADQIKTESGAK